MTATLASVSLREEQCLGREFSVVSRPISESESIGSLGNLSVDEQHHEFKHTSLVNFVLFSTF